MEEGEEKWAAKEDGRGKSVSLDTVDVYLFQKRKRRKWKGKKKYGGGRVAGSNKKREKI